MKQQCANLLASSSWRSISARWRAVRVTSRMVRSRCALSFSWWAASPSWRPTAAAAGSTAWPYNLFWPEARARRQQSNAESRILILPIPDLGSQIQKQQQKRGLKKFVVIPFFVATNFTKLNIILFLKCWRKKIRANFQRKDDWSFSPKIVTKLSKRWVWDPGSGKNLFRIPNPGVKKAPDPGSGTLVFWPYMQDIGKGFKFFFKFWRTGFF